LAGSEVRRPALSIARGLIMGVLIIAIVIILIIAAGVALGRRL
jgi:amino acid transporter